MKQNIRSWIAKKLYSIAKKIDPDDRIYVTATEVYLRKQLHMADVDRLLYGVGCLKYIPYHEVNK